MSDRREFLQTVGASLGAVGVAQLASTLLPSVAGADEKPKGGLDVRAAAADCIRAGEACVGHCTQEFAAGNKAMAACNARVHDMLALVRAMLSLSSADSTFAKRLAPLCADACKACSEACLEHKPHWEHGMHLACKDCYEACLACEKACRSFA